MSLNLVSFRSSSAGNWKCACGLGVREGGGGGGDKVPAESEIILDVSMCCPKSAGGVGGWQGSWGPQRTARQRGRKPMCLVQMKKQICTKVMEIVRNTGQPTSPRLHASSAVFLRHGVKYSRGTTCHPIPVARRQKRAICLSVRSLSLPTKHVQSEPASNNNANPRQE